MDHSQKDYDVGYKRPPRSRQFKKGQSGTPGGRRRKNGPIQVHAQGIFDEIRQILKKALEKKDFRSMAYLLGLFEKHGCVVTPKTSGVITLPTNRMPYRMAMMIAEKYGLPEDWKKRHIARCRRQFEATMTDEERECEAAGIIP